MRRTRAERGFSIALGLFAIVLAVYLFLSSPFFKLEKVYVSGITKYNEADILTMAGLQLGQNLFDIDLNNVVERLVSDAHIAQAHVRRRLPSGLHIEVQERVAVAALVADAGVWLIDGEGRVLGEAQGPHSYVVVTLGQPPAQVTTGQQIEDPVLRAAAGIAGVLPLDLKARVSEIHAVSIDHIELSLRDGMTVRFGAWRDVSEKINVLSLLLGQIQSRGAKAKVVDVSVPSSPVVF